MKAKSEVSLQEVDRIWISGSDLDLLMFSIIRAWLLTIPVSLMQRFATKDTFIKSLIKNLAQHARDKS